MQKFVNYFIVALYLFLASATLCWPTATARSEPVCTYRNSEGETIFLKYLPLLRKGQDYVDFGKDGKCLKRAICTDTFDTELEDCSKQKISCQNKARFTGVFPACCIKC